VTVPSKSGGALLVDAVLVVTTLIWAVNFSVVKATLSHIEPMAFNVLRLAGAAVLFLLLARLSPSSRVLPGDWRKLFFLGLVGHTGYQLLFIHGIDETTAGNAAVLLGLTPVFVALLARWFGTETSSTTAWIGIALSIAGVYLVLSDSAERGGSMRGDALTLGASFCWAAYTVAGQPIVARYGLLQTNAYSFLIGTILFVPFGVPALFRTETETVPAMAWGAVAFSFVFAIVVAYTLWYFAVSRIGPTQTSIYANLTPVTAIVVGWAALGERMSAPQLAGTALVLSGIYLVRAAPAKPR
jgi:drug/metabolite transporter (DMT)-like permease